MIFLKKMPASSRRKRLNLEGLIGAMVVWRYESSSSDDEEEELHHPPVVFSQIFYNGVSCFPKKKRRNTWTSRWNSSTISTVEENFVAWLAPCLKKFDDTLYIFISRILSWMPSKNSRCLKLSNSGLDFFFRNWTVPFNYASDCHLNEYCV